ncbi:universal stress protein [Haloarcula halobia]|uniref:universal stress protein n=1 Tax=Haloarcula halobia TaxID=3033388 RepID=UPI00300F9072
MLSDRSTCDQILFPTDGSEPAEAVLDYALQIASEHEATIHVLNVVDTSTTPLPEHKRM